MAEEEQDTAVEETGKSKKKLVMIAGGVVLLAIITGAGLYFSGFFEDEKQPASVESQNAGKDESAEASADDGGEATANIYQALAPPFMVNFSDGEIKVMKLAISLMAKDEQAIDAVKKHDPVIRNNILMLLATQDPESLKTAEGKIQLQVMIKEAVNKVLTERKVSSKVKEIFFTDLVMQ